MSNLGLTPFWETGIYQLERSDSPDAGVGGNGPANLQPRQLGNRTEWLYQRIGELEADLGDSIGLGDTVAQTSFDSFRANGIANLAQGRLTLVSGDSVGGASNATTLYYAPFSGDLIALYDTTLLRWDVFSFTERSLSLSGLAANTNFDIFLHNNAGTLTMSAVAWSSGTARVTTIIRQSGIWVNSSNSRRYLGTIRTTATIGQCSDDISRRFVFNAENRIDRALFGNFGGPWTYASTTSRAANNNTTTGQARLEFVVGLTNASILMFGLLGVGASSASSVTALVQLNATTTNADQSTPNSGGSAGNAALSIGPPRNGVVPIGANYAQLLEAADSGTASLNVGDIRCLLQA